MKDLEKTNTCCGSLEVILQSAENIKPCCCSAFYRRTHVHQTHIRYLVGLFRLVSILQSAT